MSTIHNRTRRSSVAHQSGGRTADTSIRNGRRRTQSVAVTRREQLPVKARTETLGDRAQGGNTSGATKLRIGLEGSEGRDYFFKPEEAKLASRLNPVMAAGIPDENPRLGERSVATYKIGELLFGDKVPLPVSFLDDIDGQRGQVIARAPGENAAEIFRKPYSADNLNLKFVNDLFNLQVIDYITGQTDRNLTNLFVEDQDGKFTGIKGIDSDTSFGSNPLATLQNARRFQNGNLFPKDIKIPQSYVDLLKSKKEELIKQWTGMLSSQESDMAKERLEKLIEDNDKKGYPEIEEMPETVKGFQELGPYLKRFADRNFESEDLGKKRQDLNEVSGKTPEKKAPQVKAVLEELANEINIKYSTPDIEDQYFRNLDAIARMLNIGEQHGNTDSVQIIGNHFEKINDGIANLESLLKERASKLKLKKPAEANSIQEMLKKLPGIKNELSKESEKLQARISALQAKAFDAEKIELSSRLQGEKSSARETLFASFLSGLPPLKQAQTEDEAQVRLYEQTTAELNELAQAYYKARNQVNTPAIQRTVAGQTRLEIARNEALQAFHNYKPPVNLTPGYLEKLDAFKDGIYQHGPIPRPQAAFNPKVGIHGQSVRAQTAAGRPRLAPMPGAPSQVEQQAQSKPAAEVAPRPSTQLRPLRAPGAPGRPQ
ncbi:hypothetical protein [Phaeodactylibacter xiamenensis]|uniref:hypothetical protein n=1 Tax=Phaeodactylibacter xiamenensis TaxID=1524460 RepID=UPI0024A7FC90|nr:hypothetical protein [Phaeodactylibacter xiamenensis]